MRIAIIGPPEIDDFAWNIADSAERMGHEVFLPGSHSRRFGHGLAGKALTFGVRGANNFEPVARFLWRRLVTEVCSFRPNLILAVESLPIELVEALGESGAPVVLWFPDHVANLGNLAMFVAPYHSLFFKEPLLVERVREFAGCNAFYLPEACNPSIHQPVHVETPRRTIAVVGNYYPTRVRLLHRLHADGIPLQLFGSPLPSNRFARSLQQLHTGKYVTALDKSVAMSSASAVLNNLHPAEVNGVNCRLFEATACGAIVVTEHRSTLVDFFERDREVLVYSTYSSLLAILGEVLERNADFVELRRRASERSHREHSYENRLAELFTKVF